MVFRVRYERDRKGWWVARVVGIRGCHTQGRSIRQARSRVREALGLFVEDAESAELVDDIRLPEAARRAVEAQRRARRDTERIRERSQRTTLEAARVLTHRLGLSVRDTAEVLGLSHQRVQQLIGE